MNSKMVSRKWIWPFFGGIVTANCLLVLMLLSWLSFPVGRAIDVGATDTHNPYEDSDCWGVHIYSTEDAQTYTSVAMTNVAIEKLYDATLTALAIADHPSDETPDD